VGISRWWLSRGPRKPHTLLKLFKDGRYGILGIAREDLDSRGMYFMVIEYHEDFALRVGICSTPEPWYFDEFDRWRERRWIRLK